MGEEQKEAEPTCDVYHFTEEENAAERAKKAADAYKIYAEVSAESKNKACIEAVEKLMERVKSEKCTHVMMLYGNENNSWYHMAMTEKTETVVGYLEMMRYSILRQNVG